MRSPINDWDAYFAAVDSKPLHPFLASLSPVVQGPGLAYDLGCGAGQGSVWLAEQGFSVIAVDIQPAALNCLRTRIPSGGSITPVQADIGELELQPCDLILCAFTLFILPAKEFETLWAKIQNSLRPGGLFIGQVLGERDDWVKDGYSYVTPVQWESLCAAYEPIVVEEIERDGLDIVGNSKHWHITHFCLKRV